jgi:hypothetical protein
MRKINKSLNKRTNKLDAVETNNINKQINKQILKKKNMENFINKQLNKLPKMPNMDQE